MAANQTWPPRAIVRVYACANTYDGGADADSTDIRFSSLVRAVRGCVAFRVFAAYDSRPHAHTPRSHCCCRRRRRRHHYDVSSSHTAAAVPLPVAPGVVISRDHYVCVCILNFFFLPPIVLRLFRLIFFFFVRIFFLLFSRYAHTHAVVLKTRSCL